MAYLQGHVIFGDFRPHYPIVSEVFVAALVVRLRVSIGVEGVGSAAVLLSATGARLVTSGLSVLVGFAVGPTAPALSDENHERCAHKKESTTRSDI